METYVVVKFGRKSGRIDAVLEGMSTGMLKLWVLSNLKQKTKDAIIFNKETGEVIAYYEGTGDMPKSITDNLGNIEDYCPGMLRTIQEEEEE